MFCYIIISTLISISIFPLSNCFPISDDRLVFPDELDSGAESDDIQLENELANPTELETEFMPELANAQEIENITHKADLENGKYFQGDMKLSPDQKDFFDTDNVTEFTSRTGISGLKYRWPKNIFGKVVIPYKIASYVYTQNQLNTIRWAMNDIEKHTCVRFKYRSNEANYINIFDDDGCYSYIGKQGGKQTVSLATDGCISKGTIIHELVHAIGFDHMQNHSDRDKYVKIYWNYIEPEHYKNFKKVNSYQFNNFATAYDYYSVMHYVPTAFSINSDRWYTIVPTKKYSGYLKVLGQRKGLSNGDVKRIRNMYHC